MSPSVSSSPWTLYLPSRPHGWHITVIRDLLPGTAKSLKATAPLLGTGIASVSAGGLIPKIFWAARDVDTRSQKRIAPSVCPVTLAPPARAENWHQSKLIVRIE